MEKTLVEKAIEFMVVGYKFDDFASFCKHSYYFDEIKYAWNIATKK